MASQDKEEEKAALFAFGEWCCYYGHSDMVLPLIQKLQANNFIVPKATPFAAGLQFYAILTSLNEITFGDPSTFERMLLIYDTLVRCAPVFQ